MIKIWHPEMRKLVWVLLLAQAVNNLQPFVHGEPIVPCYFIFGDSLSDNGNNNILITAAKANYKPYGVDFPTGQATGRFTNGLTIADYIGILLGFPDSIPPFVNHIGSDIKKGVNYASGAAGILEVSGSNLGGHISLKSQINNHGNIVKAIELLGGSDKAQEYLNKCLYYVNIGSNDYINNYFLSWSPLRRSYNLEEFAALLIKEYSQKIQELRTKYGARKFALIGIGLIGCTPQAISTSKTTNGSCVENMNAAANIFNDELKGFVDKFNTNYSADSKSILVNSTAGTVDASLGFTVLNAPCCPTRSDGQCAVNAVPCTNRNDYVFYDNIHPTQAVNQLSAIVQFNDTGSRLTYPMDINHLARLNI